MLTRLRKTIMAVARNQAHRVLGGASRGGHRTQTWDQSTRLAHARGIYDLLAPHVQPVHGRVGLEIGPGDNLEVCRLFVEAGAARVVAVERFAHPTEVPPGVQLVREEIECLPLSPASVDFAYANDVFEHVRDVPAAFRAVFRCMKPGGVFANSVDLRGHNSYRDLEHLTCPDWLYHLMHSHIVTSNRVRAGEFAAHATAAGFEVVRSDALAVAAPAYVTALRTRLLPRWRTLPDSDLGTLQLLLICHRP